MKPNYKPTDLNDNSLEEPKLYLVVNDEKFPRPGLESSFVDYSEINEKTQDKLTGCLCDPVTTSICSCNKVKVCNCVGYTSCSCASDRSGSVITGCRCAPVH